MYVPCVRAISTYKIHVFINKGEARERVRRSRLNLRDELEISGFRRGYLVFCLEGAGSHVSWRCVRPSPTASASRIRYSPQSPTIALCSTFCSLHALSFWAKFAVTLRDWMSLCHGWRCDLRRRANLQFAVVGLCWVSARCSGSPLIPGDSFAAMPRSSEVGETS